jgi:hypothetical protein
MPLSNVYAIFFAALNLAVAQLFVMAAFGVRIGPWTPEGF